MKLILTKEQEIIKLIFKDFLEEYNSRNISSKVGISHVGAFKILKKLEKKEVVTSKKVGNANIYSLNFENPLTLREIETSLTIEALNYRKWMEEFRKLEGKVKFAILFGSILRNEGRAKDIDLHVVADRRRYKEIQKIVDDKNTILLKKVHLIYQTPKDFGADLKRRYSVIIEIIKTGIVLFGQDKFRKMVMER